MHFTWRSALSVSAAAGPSVFCCTILSKLFDFPELVRYGLVASPSHWNRECNGECRDWRRTIKPVIQAFPVGRVDAHAGFA